jgi:ABC-type dipeptide/oligopeptide/nickel transport system permease subunit
MDTNDSQIQLDEPLAPKRTRLEEFWRLFKQNRLAILGLAFFIFFFCAALIGLTLTAGTDPVFDPALVRLQEKLRPPLAKPNLDSLLPNQIPTLGLYLCGTDDLGRDVFARMLQGAWVSLTVGFVAVGIAVVIGIFMGGIAGYYGQRHIRVNQLVIAGLFFSGAISLIAGLIFLLTGFSGGTIFLLLGFVWLASSNGRGLTLFRDNPDNMRSLLKGITIGLLVFASVILVANAIP